MGGVPGTRRASVLRRFVLILALAFAHAQATPQAPEEDAVAADTSVGGVASIEDDTLAAMVANLRVEARHDRIRALHELVSGATEEDYPALIDVLGDPGVSVRIQWRILRALGMMGVQEVAPVAAALVIDPARNEGVRQAAAMTLADLKAKVHAPALLEAARNDAAPLVRIIAAGAYLRVMGKSALPEINRLAATETDPYAKEHLDWYPQLIRHGQTFTIRPRAGETVTCAHAGTKYLVYAPRDYGEGQPHNVLVSVHGTFGSAARYLDIAKERADAESLVVVAPWFDAATFPSFDNFNLDNVGIGMPRSDLRLLEILDSLPTFAHARTDRVYLFGHSKGGQFTQRFVFAHPDRILRAASCGSGIYVAPGEESKGGYGEMFPYGATPNPFAPDLADRTFEGLIAAPIAFFVGTQDPRITDAHRFVRESQFRARKEGYIPQLEVRLLPSVGHDGRETFPPAAAFLFDE